VDGGVGVPDPAQVARPGTGRQFPGVFVRAVPARALAALGGVDPTGASLVGAADDPGAVGGIRSGERDADGIEGEEVLR
jgi:hypothetical protein